MAAKFDKDAWIADALLNRYIVAHKNGAIFRLSGNKTSALTRDGYLLVALQVHKKSGRVYFNMTWKGITKSVLVNRVVALRFLPNPLHLPQVNHIDGNKENNALSNLEWSSGSDNEKHAHRTGLKTGRGSANSNAKLTAPQVLEIRESREDDVTVAARLGVARSTIVNIRKRKTWKHI